MVIVDLRRGNIIEWQTFNAQRSVAIYLTHQTYVFKVESMNAKKAIKFPETLHHAIKYFADEDRALDFMKSIRWPI